MDYNIPALAKALHEKGVNPADDMQSWRRLCFSLASEHDDYEEEFLMLAEESSKYDKKENERIWDRARDASIHDISIAYFLKVCKDAGIELRKYGSRVGSGECRVGSETTKTITKTTMQTKVHPPLRGNEGVSALPNTLPQTFLSAQNQLIRALLGLGIFTPDQAERATRRFMLGRTREDFVVYWQIDESGLVREGKLMHYGPDAHRTKWLNEQGRETGASWVSFVMKHHRAPDGRPAPLLPLSWSGSHCLFGLHQLSDPENRTRPIAIVEAEKTAVICSELLRPDLLWMATGGLGELSVEKLRPLCGHKIFVFPDTDPDGSTFRAWNRICIEARQQLRLDLCLMTALENRASAEQKRRKIDIADYMLERREGSVERGVGSEESGVSSVESGANRNNNHPPELTAMIAENPAIRELVNVFGLVPVSSV